MSGFGRLLTMPTAATIAATAPPTKIAVCGGVAWIVFECHGSLILGFGASSGQSKTNLFEAFALFVNLDLHLWLHGPNIALALLQTNA